MSVELNFPNNSSQNNEQLNGAKNDQSIQIDENYLKNLLGDILLNKNNESNNFALVDSLWNTAEEEILPMLYSSPSINIKIIIENREYIALIDTGATCNVLSKKIVKDCGLNDYLDTRYKGVARGIGTSKIEGVIPYLNIKIEDYECPCKFSVLDSENVDIILGQSFMMYYKVKMDFENRTLQISDTKIPMIIIDH